MGRKITQESKRQIRIRTMPAWGEALYHRVWKEQEVTNDPAPNMHEFWTLGSGYGKSRLGYGRAVQALERGYGGIILDAASVISAMFIRYLAQSGFPPEKTLIVDFGREFTDGYPALNFQQTGEGVSDYRAVEELVNATVTLSEMNSSSGPRQIELARHLFLALQLAGKPFVDVDLFCTDAGFREHVCKAAQDPTLQRFWVGKEAYVNTLPKEALNAVKNKFSGLCMHPMTRPIISYRDSPIDLYESMQQGHWWIINLSEDYLGNDIQQRMGQLFQCLLRTSTIRRQRTAYRPPFLAICDEYPQYKSYITHKSLLRISRNMGLGLIFLCQDTEPFSDSEFFVLTGNCATLGTGNVSKHDAEAMAGEIFLNNHGSTWRDWESTRNFSSPEELRAYAGLIMQLEEGQIICRIKPSHDAYVVDVPYIEYPRENPRLETAFRKAVAEQWYRKPSRSMD